MTLADVVIPSLKQSGNPSGVVANRGPDVRGYDRRKGRHVYGPRHEFQETTDLLLENGLFRFWVGNRGLPAFLNVEAVAGGAWNHEGYVRLSDSNVLHNARLVIVTPDFGIVRLDIKNEGPSFLVLRRGERGVRVVAGDEIGPLVSASRTIRWTGTPPYAELSNVYKDQGLFAGGLHNSWGRARFLWPPMQSVDAWSYYLVWLPLGDNDGDGTGELDEWGGDTGEWGEGEWGGSFGANPGRILTLEDSTGEVGDVSYDNVSKRIEFTLAGNQVVSSAISFDAGDAVRILARFSTEEGMALSVKNGDGAVAHYSGSSYTDPGTTEDAYAVHGVGPADLGQMGGVFDQASLFEDRLTNTEATALLEQTSRTAGLPSSEGRLVWFAPFDVNPVANLGADDSGLSHRTMPSLGIYATESGTTSDLGAYLTTNETEDTPTAVLGQFVTDSQQETRIR